KSTEMPALDGQFGRYQLVGEIARGGMGAVLRGRDTDLGRELAIKVLLEAHADRPEVIQRFIEEAQISGQLQHPGIAPVYELGQFADKRPFFSMKLVKGKTLSALLSDRAKTRHTSADDVEPKPPKDLSRFLGIFEHVCQTLAYAHSRGVIHRDLKPANVMVGAFGEVQVMDWGLAKVLPAGGVADEKKAKKTLDDLSVIRTIRSVQVETPGFGSETHAGSVLGTPAYMAPEQALGEVDRLDERADVFGLGAILCEILTGRPPYVADSGAEVYRLAVRAKLDDANQRLDECGADTELIAITKQCLSSEPNDRARDAGVLANQLAEYFASVQTRLARAERTAVEAKARAIEEKKRRTVTLALAASVLLTGLLIAGGWAWISHQDSVHQREITQRQSRLTQQINDALSEAQLLRAKADAGGLQDIVHLVQAQQAVGRAEALAETETVAPELLNRIRELKQDLVTESKDRGVVAALEKARTERVELNRQTRNVPVDAVADAYRNAFVEFGIEVGIDSPAAAAKLIRQRRDAVRDSLIAAIDDWILLAPRGVGVRVDSSRGRHVIASILPGSFAAEQGSLHAGDQLLAIANSPDNEFVLLKGKDTSDVLELLAGDPGSNVVLRVASNAATGQVSKPAEPRDVQLQRGVDLRAWLKDLAIALDPDSWRIQSRLAIEHMEREDLLELADDKTALTQPTPAIVSLALALVEIDEPAECVRLLRSAQRRYPNDFWINYTLGVQLHRSNPPQYRDAIRFYTAALAIRPQAIGAGLNLGDAYEVAGELDDAIASYRTAVDAKPNDAKALMHLGNALMKRTEAEAPSSVEWAALAHNDSLPDSVQVASVTPRPGSSFPPSPSAPETKSDSERPIAESDPKSRKSPPNPTRKTTGRPPFAVYPRGTPGTNGGDPQGMGSRLAGLQQFRRRFGQHRDSSINEAVDVLTQAVKKNPDSIDAQCCLAKALQQKGMYEQSVVHFQQGHDLATKTNDSRPTERWLKDAESLATWGNQLKDLLKKAMGKEVDPAHQTRICSLFRNNVHGTAKMYADTSASDETFAETVANGGRLAAARTVLLVSGVNTLRGGIDPAGIQRLRTQAAKWMNADLDAIEARLKQDTATERESLAKILKQWQADFTFRLMKESDANPDLAQVATRIEELLKRVKQVTTSK
ncbi:MAG: protein kinase, partial [Planctomycetota bacterium]|nr:protein kinase [Planctomycetota bacterium]